MIFGDVAGVRADPQGADDPSDDQEKRAISEGSVVAPVKDMDCPLILLSDDDPALIRALERQATRAGLWVITDVNSDVMRLAKQFHPDLIVLDLNQLIDGTELLSELKRDPETASTSVIMLSSDDRPEVADTCLQLGALAFLEKPFDVSTITELARLAGNAMRRRIPAPRIARPPKLNRSAH